MRGLKFRLSGNMACFRKPETNSSVYLTFLNIHKIALLGILGSVIGLEGYEQAKDKEFPEFYLKLNNLKISIAPPKKNIIQQLNVFNNSTGIASEEDGGNLIVKENILINPEWIIYILDNGTDEYKKLENYLINRKTEFIPYLGRNDYPANISDVEVIELNEIVEDEIIYDSLVTANLSDCVRTSRKNKFLLIEKLPIDLDENSKHYVYDSFLLSDEYLKKQKDSYSWNNNNLKFI